MSSSTPLPDRARAAGLGGRIGLALGSGAARGWAHVGVLRALEEAGLAPQIVCGSSSGAIAGAMYAAGQLDRFETWGRQLDWRQVVAYFDLSLRGGLIKARKLIDFLTEELRERTIESLERRFAAVATDLATGREVWLREGSLVDCMRASIALPGLITPVRLDGRWLVDGGLVNPVPVSLCRALGADSVIAVDLNTTLLGRRVERAGSGDADGAAAPESEAPPARVEDTRIGAAVREFLADLRERAGARDGAAPEEAPPSIYEVVVTSINVMQVRITRSRMAGDPPDLLITPRLHDFALLDFDRAAEAIDEGRRAVAHALAVGSPQDLAP
ncbi:MAG: patatin-like phospholipase family protein [Deltaproteobacteria bacterium]|nr:MAG: patatin-like phospholipase family protein [Deltaproteobacteria bacterium]